MPKLSEVSVNALSSGLFTVNLAACKTSYDTDVNVTGTTAQYIPIYGIADKGAWKIPAGTIGPNGKFSSIRIEGYLNIRNTSDSYALGVGFGITIDSPQSEGGTSIANTKFTYAIPTGLSSRFVKYSVDMTWNNHSGGRLQCVSHTFGLKGPNTSDENFMVDDTFDDQFNPLRSWDKDHAIYFYARVQQTANMIIGSRNCTMWAMP